MRRVDHPHRAVHHHVPLPALPEPVFQQDLQSLPDAVGQRHAGPELRLPPPATSAPAAVFLPATNVE